MRIKKFIKIIVFSSIFLILLNRIYTILSWKDTAGDYRSSVDSFYELEEDVVDVLFFGSSHCYCSVDPSVLWNDHGIASFNLSISGQDFAGTYYTMKEALKTQSPKVLCVDLYGATYSGYEVEGNLYRSTLPFKISKNSYEMIDSLVQEEERKKEFWFRWPVIHTRYREVKEEDFRADLPTYLGYCPVFNTRSVGELIPYTGEEIAELPQEREMWLRKMIELARENNIGLCFFIAPYEASVPHQKLLQSAKRLAEEESIPVLDMIELSSELKIDVHTDFCDWAHTNYSGAQKVSDYIGDYFTKNYDLADHRGDARYALWDEDSKVRAHEEREQRLKKISDVWNYLDTISVLEDYLVVLSTAGNYLAPENDVSEYLQAVGVGPEFYQKNGIWVFDNKELIYMTNEEYALKNIDLGTDDLILSRVADVNTIIVDDQLYQMVSDGINIMVYDKVLGRVVDSVGFNAAGTYVIVR